MAQDFREIFERNSYGDDSRKIGAIHLLECLASVSRVSLNFMLLQNSQVSFAKY